MSLNKARELRQERAKLDSELRAMNEEQGDSPETPDFRAKWDKTWERMEELRTQYEAIENREAQLKESAEALEARHEYLEGIEDRGFAGVVDDSEERADIHRRAFQSYLKNDGDWRAVHDEVPEVRALGSQVKGTNASGGFTVPTDFRAELYNTLKAYGGARQTARIITTDNGRNLQIPRSDDTANSAKLISEATAISTSTIVSFGQVTLEAHKYRVGPIKLARELLQDSALDPMTIVRDAIAVRFGRATNAHYTTRSSTETTGPHGLINGTTGPGSATAIAASLATVTPEDLLDLLHSVDPAYRPGARWTMNDATFAGIRKIRWGSSGEFAWQAGTVAGAPDTLFGYPVVINQDMQSFGSSGNKVIGFGNWEAGFVIRDVQGVDVKLLQELYAEQDVVALLAFMRTDARPVLPSTVHARKPYHFLVQSTG